jgi:glycosyltransferase involved in cell wall biosynthesis
MNHGTMRVLVEAVGCRYGGIATYVRNLSQHWTTEYPDDEIHVLRGTDDHALAAPGVPSTVVAVPRPAVATRPLVQTRQLRRLTEQWRADVVLAARPATTMLHVPAPLAVVVHDLRHELRPEQFSAGRRAIRWISYGRAYSLADGFVTISHKTLADLHERHPRLAARPAVVVHHGADHVDDWLNAPGKRYVVAFGHHSNKNVELVLDAWRLLAASGGLPAGLPQLVVLHNSEDKRAGWDQRVQQHGIGAHVTFAPYLDDAELRTLMTNAALVLFPSDFEGFGLPVVEAMRLRKPIVVSPDPAVGEVAGGHAVTMTGWGADALAGATRAALLTSDTDLDAAQRYTDAFTWARAVHQTREFLHGLL